MTERTAAQPAVGELGDRLAGRGHWWMVSDVDPVADALVTFWSAH